METVELKPVVIVGAGETAALAYEYFTHDSPRNVAAFSVEQPYLQEDSFLGLPVVPFETLEEKFTPQAYDVFVAVSSTKLNRVRTRLFKTAKAKGYQCASYVSSKAFLWHNVEIGENCFVLEDNTLQPYVQVGNNVVLWSGNHVGHNTKIADHCFIASQVVISGFCEIGESCFLGVNSTVINNISIGQDCFIGAGVLIQKDTQEAGVYQAESTKPSAVSSHRLFRIRE